MSQSLTQRTPLRTVRGWYTGNPPPEIQIQHQLRSSTGARYSYVKTSPAIKEATESLTTDRPEAVQATSTKPARIPVAVRLMELLLKLARQKDVLPTTEGLGERIGCKPGAVNAALTDLKLQNKIVVWVGTGRAANTKRAIRLVESGAVLRSEGAPADITP